MTNPARDGLATEFATFRERRERSAFIAQRFAPYLAESVLDVGCYEAPLRTLLQGTRYCGVDIVGAPDIVLDLERAERLPFADGEYRTVICIEVLEHLDSLHRLFGELARVASRNVIVSLPNCWRDARRPIGRGRGHFAHYGLPLEAPVDRHKWFFSYAEARDFLRASAARHGLQVEEMFGTEQHRNALLRAARRIAYPGERYHNRYVQTVWAVLAKGPVSAPRG
jgi:hypothetical protein